MNDIILEETKPKEKPEKPKLKLNYHNLVSKYNRTIDKEEKIKIIKQILQLKLTKETKQLWQDKLNNLTTKPTKPKPITAKKQKLNTTIKSKIKTLEETIIQQIKLGYLGEIGTTEINILIKKGYNVYYKPKKVKRIIQPYIFLITHNNPKKKTIIIRKLF